MRSTTKLFYCNQTANMASEFSNKREFSSQHKNIAMFYQNFEFRNEEVQSSIWLVVQ